MGVGLSFGSDDSTTVTARLDGFSLGYSVLMIVGAVDVRELEVAW